MGLNPVLAMVLQPKHCSRKYHGSIEVDGGEITENDVTKTCVKLN